MFLPETNLVSCVLLVFLQCNQHFKLSAKQAFQVNRERSAPYRDQDCETLLKQGVPVVVYKLTGFPFHAAPESLPESYRCAPHELVKKYSGAQCDDSAQL